jgi:hypothetical protein
MHPDTDLSVYSFGLSTDHDAFCFKSAVADLNEERASQDPPAPKPTGNVIPFRPRHAEPSPSAPREDAR